MNKTILLLLTAIPSMVFGQGIKKITDKENDEIFYVLKSDKTLKHGEYKKFSYNKKLLVKGFYKHGVNDSIWEFYDFNGEVRLKYDFTKSDLIFNKSNGKVLKTLKYKLINDNNNPDTTLSRPPIFLGGDDYIISELFKKLRYPINAQENGKSGIVYVIFTIDKNGKTGNYHVDNPIGFGMDEEAIRVLKLLPDYWLPGLKNGQPADVEIVFPITFKLS